MRKITFLFLFTLLFSVSSTFAQDTKTNTSQTVRQWNFGFLGASYEIPLGKNISIAPFAGTDFDLDWITLGAKGNFYFDNLLNLPAAWDVYGGANAGFSILLNDDINKDDDLNLGLHVGGRWFWSENWGVYAEFGSGTTAGTSGIGLTWKK